MFLHGGTVWAESPGEGQGATFTVRLPLKTIHRQTKEDSTQLDCPLDLSELKILVVDDEVDSREFVTFALEQCGAVVTAVASAGEALEALALEKPDLLVSDIGMPAAYASESDSQQALSAGFQRHLGKPVEPAELIGAIATLIRGNSE